tara:strand:- start:22164 stop:23498 length:1335 start_codon:yes stop_codon:yes gene_type:complete
MIPAPRNRLEKYLLLTGSNGEEFLPFQATLKNLHRQGYKLNTIDQYAGHIARFIDYIYEAALHMDSITAEFIQDAIDLYKSYLLFGVDSQYELASNVAKELKPAHKTHQSSLGPIGAAIKYFLLLSDVKALAEDQETLFSQFSKPQHREFTKDEHAKIKQSNMLAGVLRGGIMYTKRSGGLFGKSNSSNKKHKKHPVPFDLCCPLIESAASYRNKAMYSLLAASGARQHEVYQLRLRDIDIENLKVFLVDPETRDNSDLTEEQFKKLAWKGRATEKTFLIEPFKTLFFENLHLYMKHERIAHGIHDFVFQKQGGQPYFITSRTTRSDDFKICKEKVGLGGSLLISLHSFRHTYGTYALNYLPTGAGFGLPITTVKLLMGHESLESTEIYSKEDEDLIEAKLEFANQQVFGLDKPLSLKEIKLRYHQLEIERLLDTKAIEREGLL